MNDLDPKHGKRNGRNWKRIRSAYVATHLLRGRRARQGRYVPVEGYKLFVKDSVEEKILKLQEAKSDLADEILSGDGTGGGLGSLSREDLLELLGV